MTASYKDINRYFEMITRRVPSRILIGAIHCCETVLICGSTELSLQSDSRREVFSFLPVFGERLGWHGKIGDAFAEMGVAAGQDGNRLSGEYSDSVVRGDRP